MMARAMLTTEPRTKAQDCPPRATATIPTHSGPSVKPHRINAIWLSDLFDFDRGTRRRGRSISDASRALPNGSAL